MSNSSTSGEDTVGALMQWGVEFLREKKIEDPELSVEWILSELLNCSRLELPFISRERLPRGKVLAFKRMISRRARGEPVQYIVGHWDFWDFQVSVDRNTLIPRPETELLVERSLQLFKDGQLSKEPTILDLGTGSGAIACALARNIPDARVFATDISEKALEVAEKNLKRLNLQHRVKLFLGDLFSPFENSSIKFDLIVSNPPYIPTEQLKTLPSSVVEFEPLIALDGGKDGLDVIRRILSRAPLFLKDGGVIILESFPKQIEKIAEIAKRYGYRESSIFRDLSQNLRCIVIKR